VDGASLADASGYDKSGVVGAVEGASLADASGYDGGRSGLAKRFCYRVR
jgi:hypothetical protein